MASNRMWKENVRPAAQSIYGDELVAFFETLALASFRQREVSVTLGRPEEPDCPLIGVSDGFERLTGYLRREIVGRNCRFLNQGCIISAVDRHAMRVCLRAGQSFTGVLQNRRKNGELFSNLLSMRTLRIGNMSYILGIQIDVTNMKVDLASEKTASEITVLIDAVFSANVEAWANRNVTEWITHKSHCGIRRPLIPLHKVLDSASRQPENYEQAKNEFVSLEASLDQNNLNIKNTFWEVYNVYDDSKAKLTELRKVTSEPSLGSRGWLLDQSPRTYRQDCLRRLHSSLVARPLLPLSKFKLTPSINKSQAAPSLIPFSKFELVLSSDHSQALNHEDRAGTGDDLNGQPLDVAPKGPPPDNHEDESSVAEKTLENIVADLASAGSANHPVDCNPCSFFCFSLMGCARGSECTFCHMKHPRRIRRRGHRRKKVVEIEFMGVDELSAEKMAAKRSEIASSDVDDTTGCEFEHEQNRHE